MPIRITVMPFLSWSAALSSSGDCTSSSRTLRCPRSCQDQRCGSSHGSRPGPGCRQGPGVMSGTTAKTTRRTKTTSSWTRRCGTRLGFAKNAARLRDKMLGVPKCSNVHHRDRGRLGCRGDRKSGCMCPNVLPSPHTGRLVFSNPPAFGSR